VSKFTWGDGARIESEAPDCLRPGSAVAIVGVVEQHERRGTHFDSFAEGVIYTVEFEDGTSLDVHEGHLVPLD
jgi:hypothetical protein